MDEDGTAPAAETGALAPSTHGPGQHRGVSVYLHRRQTESRRPRPGLSVEGPSLPAGAAPQARRGFSLVELMIALVLLSVGVMATAQVFAVANQHTVHAREETAGVCLAQEIREKIMSESFGDIHSIFNHIDTNVPATVPTTAATWAAHVTAELGPRGRGTVTVDTPTDDPMIPNGMVAVTVTIYWREGSRTISLPLRFNVAKTSA
jgi:prepilin-type N-terminal cleavage/methylation domain-containing protein